MLQDGSNANISEVKHARSDFGAESQGSTACLYWWDAGFFFNFIYFIFSKHKVVSNNIKANTFV